jgi:hypothetical protein
MLIAYFLVESESFRGSRIRLKRSVATRPQRQNYRRHTPSSRALTHLESIGSGNAAFMSMGGPQAHGNSKPPILQIGSRFCGCQFSLHVWTVCGRTAGWCNPVCGSRL